LRGLAGVAANVHRLGALLEAELERPLRFAAGLHCGRAVVGEVGFRDHVTFTALGDPPNVAARLQDLAKDFDCEAVLSDDVIAIAGLDAAKLTPHLAEVRGRAEAVPVRLCPQADRCLDALRVADAASV